jgi:erythritol transport system substrate-binding protein
MQSLLQAHPDIIGVTSGNDEMALGAIAALKEVGKLSSIKVGGFDGSPDAVAAIKAGDLQYTVLQPVAVYSAKAVNEADSFLKTGKTGATSEKQLFDCLLITKDNLAATSPRSRSSSECDPGVSFGTLLPHLDWHRQSVEEAMASIGRR